MSSVRDLTYPAVVLAAKTSFKLLDLTVDVHGAENVPRTGGAVLALNHVSYVDFILGGFAAQPSDRLVRFMAKRELFTHRLAGPLMRSLHHIEVDRGDGLKSFAEANRYLRAGEVVGIFPEATISRAMELKEFKSGAPRLAADVGVPLVPAVLWGTQRMMTKDHPRDFSRGQHVAITVGEPLHPSGDRPVDETAELKASMAVLLDETIRRYPDPPDGHWWAPASYGGTAPTLEQAAVLDAAEKRDRAKRFVAKEREKRARAANRPWKRS
ncbi:lysophospholipid acyltransferase family protein [soil metagenome]